MAYATQNQQDPTEKLVQSARRLFRLGLLGILGIILIYVATNSIEHVDQDHIMAIQYPSGHIEWFQNGGYHLQWFGKVVKFPRRKQFWFADKDGSGNTINQQIKVRFNDGGHGDVYGSVAWEMPSDVSHLTALYQKYGSADAIDHDLVQTVVGKSVYMTGPLMSSKESYAEKRNDLINYIEDQIKNGVYQTETTEAQVTDSMGDKRTVNIVKIREAGGKTLRQEISPLQDFGIKTFNLSITNIAYDETVEKQIKSQQEATMQVQTAIAQARQAEQQAVTAAKNGEAEAAKAKWEQEVIKARAVTEAQQKLEVAQLDAKAADQEKQANILRGQGEAERRKLVMAADGALDKKLDALVKINSFYADAIKGYQGNWVSAVSMGGNTANGVAGASDLIKLLTANTARELSVSLDTPTGGNKK